MTYTIGELFAGVGGFSLAFHAAGATTSWFVEREPYPQQVLRKNFPGVPVHGDIYDCRNLPYVDIITAGFPCQPFSHAGLRKGDKDERYLVPEMLRVIQEVQPRVILFENVPGFANIAAGDTFREFLRALAQIGHDAEWDHFRASDVGAPHRRERWFCVAYRDSGNGNGWAEPREGRSNRTEIRSITPSLVNPQQQRPATGPAGETRQAHSDAERDGTAAEPGRNHEQPGAVGAGELGNAQSNGCQRRQPEGEGAATINTSGNSNTRRKFEPRFCRSAHGLSARLDGHQWPARPGQPQHAWEPPRVTTERENRTARLKALGNAVVPQVVYPIACSIVEWLAAQDVAGVVT